MTEQGQALPEGMVQVDVNLVVQGYREMVSNLTEQNVLQSARIKMLEKSNGELVAALNQAHVALTQAQADQDAAKELETTTNA